MRLDQLSRLIAAAALAGVAVNCGQPPPEPDRLPDSLGEWTASDDAAEFAGDDLFVYINGGAEIYHEHGFEQLRVRDYSRSDERISVELYTMADSAYGIYSYARSAAGQPVGLGAGGTVADYYLHFWSGPHLIAVTAQGGAGDSQPAVLEVGGLLAGGFPAAGEVPPLMDLLPVEGCVPGSEQYVVGPIGLNIAAPRAAALFRGFAEAATTACRSPAGDETTLVVLRWDDPSDAAQAVTAAFERAASIKGIATEPADDAGFGFRFDQDEMLVGRRTAATVWLALTRSGEPPDLDRLFPSNTWEVSHE